MTNYEWIPHLMNLSKTAVQSAVSLRTITVELRVCRSSSNTSLCSVSTSEWTCITFTSSVFTVWTRRLTSLPFPWASRASIRCTSTIEWFSVVALFSNTTSGFNAAEGQKCHICEPKEKRTFKNKNNPCYEGFRCSCMHLHSMFHQFLNNVWINLS